MIPKHRRGHTGHVKRWHSRECGSPGMWIWGSLHNLPYVFSPGLSYAPPPPTTLLPRSGSYGYTQACQYKLAMTTLRTPDHSIAIGAGLPQEKSLVALLTLKNLDYPDGWGIYWKVDFWVFYPTVGGNGPLSISRTASHSSSELTWWRNLAEHGWGIESRCVDANKTPLYHESIHQRVTWSNT